MSYSNSQLSLSLRSLRSRRLKKEGCGIDIDRTFSFTRWLKKLAVGLLLLYRRLRYGYPYRRIRLAGPRYAKVDPEDYERFKDYDWYAIGRAPNFYAQRLVREGKTGRIKLLTMHREIINPPEGMTIDHINRDKTDNRKGNLRQATHSQNQANKAKTRRPGTSRYKGVSLRKCRRTRQWRAAVQFNRKSVHLGYFETEVEAAKAYDEGAKKYHGEFAYLNFPELTTKGAKSTKKNKKRIWKRKMTASDQNLTSSLVYRPSSLQNFP